MLSTKRVEAPVTDLYKMLLSMKLCKLSLVSWALSTSTVLYKDSAYSSNQANTTCFHGKLSLSY